MLVTGGKAYWQESTTQKCAYCHKPYREEIYQEGEVKVLVRSLPACNCEKKYARLSARVAQSQIRPLYRSMTFDAFDGSRQPDAFNRAAQYAKKLKANIRSGRGLIFYGPVGTGKTHLAAAIVNHALKNYLFCIIQSVPEMFFHIRQQNFESINGLMDCDLLVLDDFGRERATDFVRETLFTVINARYEKQKPIIITTNMGPRTLKANIGEAVVSRLYQMCDIVEMKNSGDYRAHQKKSG